MGAETYQPRSSSSGCSGFNEAAPRWARKQWFSEPGGHIDYLLQ